MAPHPSMPMSVFSEPHAADRCCLCGSAERLTGEHKVKASLIRTLFSGDPMMIGHFDGATRPKLAQSDKSKAFHFKSKLCGACNSARTQPADLEFDRFDALARDILARGHDPGLAFDDERYLVGSAPYLYVFRYLAKVLACQIAEVEGPRLTALTGFAMGLTDVNPIRLAVGPDGKYRMWFGKTGDPHFAGHGGLGASFSRRLGLLESLSSSLTIGPLRYEFGIAFGPAVAIAVRLLHPAFHRRCSAAYREAMAAEAA